MKQVECSKQGNNGKIYINIYLCCKLIIIGLLKVGYLVKRLDYTYTLLAYQNARIT